MGKWTNGQMDNDKWTNGQMDKWTKGQMDKWTNGQMDKWTNGQTDKQKDRCVNVQVEQLTVRKTNKNDHVKTNTHRDRPNYLQTDYIELIFSTKSFETDRQTDRQTEKEKNIF
jgi:hypothetical protein